VGAFEVEIDGDNVVNVNDVDCCCEIVKNELENIYKEK